MREDDDERLWWRWRQSSHPMMMKNDERRKWTSMASKRRRRPWPTNCCLLAIFLPLLLLPQICIGQQFQQQQQSLQQNARVQSLPLDPALQPVIHPGIISRVSQSGLNLLAEYLRTRVHRFMRFSALQYNFSVPFPSHNAEISVRSLETAHFDQSAFQSRIQIAPFNRELVWSGTEFRAAIISLIQLRALDQRRAELGASQIPLRLEKVRIELALGSAVNLDGHLRTDVRQCRIISGELLFENLFQDSANLSAFIPIVHQITLSRLSEMICPVFVAELGPVISNRLLNSPLSTALFDHYFLNFGLANGILYQSNENNTNTNLPDPAGGQLEGPINRGTTGGILLFHRGNVFGILRQVKTRINDFRLPILPPPMSPTPLGPMSQKMVAFQMSNYTFGSLFFWMDQYRKFDYEISQTTIKDKEIAAYLKTECGQKDICAGTLFPALAQNFPNGLVSIKSRTITFPGVQIERGKAILTVESRINAFANYSEQTRRFLTANMRAKVSLQNATFSNYLLRAELGIDTFDISNVQSMVDGIDVGSIEFLVNALNELIIAEDMRHKLKDGIRLPLLLDFEQFGPGEVRFEDGLLLLGADLCFDENCKRTPATATDQQQNLNEHSVDMDANYYDSVN